MTGKSYISVGMTASLSGRYAVQGSQALAGVQAWVDDVNDLGGIRLNEKSRSVPVRLTHYDDESDSGQCALLTERLLTRDGINILIGPYSSGLALRAASVAEEHHRVLWNHGGASESIFSRGFDWVVGILTPNSRYFHGVIDYSLYEHPAVRTVAIVHSTAGAFPREVASGAETYCAQLGFEPIKKYTYPSRTDDFSEILSQIKKSHPGLILKVGRIEDDIRFARQLVDAELSVAVAGLIAAPLNMFGETLGSDSEGFIGPSQWESESVPNPEYGPTSEQVLKSLEGRNSSGVDYPMAQAYAGCLIAQKCIEKAGTLDNRALRMAANELDFTTFYGRFKIDAATGRQLGHAMPVIQWHRGVKRTIWPPHLARRSDY